MSSTNESMETDIRNRVLKRKKLNKVIQTTINSFPFRTKSFQELWKQHTAAVSLSRLDCQSITKMDRCNRRMIRHALHTRDKLKVIALVRKGIDINMTLSDLFSDTPLMYAIKHGYLEIVEIILQIPGCKTDVTNKNGHTILDEAVQAYLVLESSCKQVVASRYRIVKCLLRHNVGNVTLGFMDILLFSCIHNLSGKRKVRRLTKLAAESQCHCFKDALLCLLVPYEDMHEQVKHLLYNDASVTAYIFSHTYLTSLPPQNVSVLIKYSTSSPAILQHLAYNIVDMNNMSKAVSSHQWIYYQEVFRLLVLCGQELPLAVMTFLYEHDKGFYRMVSAYETKPRPLLDLSRLVARRSMENIVNKVLSITGLPKAVQKVLLLED